MTNKINILPVLQKFIILIKSAIYRFASAASHYKDLISVLLCSVVVVFVLWLLLSSAEDSKNADTNTDHASNKSKGVADEDVTLTEFKVININKRYMEYRDKLHKNMVCSKSKEIYDKNIKHKHNLFMLTFDGDLQASAVPFLADQITAILQVAQKKDEVVLKLKSGGGYVNSYGLAANQLERLRRAGIYLTVAVDEVSASGGYMMAVVANRIIAAPFAIIGSIGVISELININKLLKNSGIEVESHTAGKFKRTLTTYGENTEEGREEFKKDLNNTHELFKAHIAQYREVNMDEVANGKYWFGKEALELNLVDELSVSDDYIYQKYISGHYNILYLKTVKKTAALQSGVKTLIDRVNSLTRDIFSWGKNYFDLI